MRKGSDRKSFLGALSLTLSLTAVLMFTVWQMASEHIVPEQEELMDQVVFLSSELDSIKPRLDRLRARIAVLERETEIVRKANKLLQQGESERQAENARLQSELDFYRRLAGTGGAQSGLDIYRVEIIPTESEKVFQFVMTLTQNIRRAAIISGHARIDIEGTLSDRPVTLHWSQVVDAGAAEPSFRFKYFQQLEGYLTLPEGFGPTQILITLEARDQKKAVVRRYDWNDLLDY